jgi:putative transposase
VYSYEDRVRAVQLYIKYDRSIADTIRELGYPSRSVLPRWYKDYQANGDLGRKCKRTPKYSIEEKKAAVDYYLEHGQSLRRTIRAMGYL